MNQMINTGQTPAQMPMPLPMTRTGRTERPVVRVHIPQPAIKLPPRGTTGPVHISQLLNPIREICRHPDRDRLLAELFREY